MNAKQLAFLSSIKWSGDIHARGHLSAVAKIGSYLVVGADEGVGVEENENIIQVLKEVGPRHYNVSHHILLFKGNQKDGKEMDIEGISVEGDMMYIVGSHSCRRKRVKRGKSYKQNRKRFENDQIGFEKNRDWLYRLKIDSEIKEVERKRISLRDIIDKDAVLKTFSRIPSKENGVDIEGIVVVREWLCLGFRSPVLRGNYVPMMKLKFDDPEDTYELLYVQLEGRGCRDIAPVVDGFLILAGPVGDGSVAYKLYHWDGKDTIIGKNRSREEAGTVMSLGEVPTPEGGKPEGIAIIEEGTTYYDVLIVYDGIEANVARCFRADKS